MFVVLNTHFQFIHLHHQLPTITSHTTPSHLSNHFSIMATIPPHDPQVESSTKAPSPSTPLQAEYAAAITAHKQQVAHMTPTRKEYDGLFAKHEKIQARVDKIAAKMSKQRSIYQRHKQHVVSLSNALLASNTALRSAPKPFSDVKALTQATLLHELRVASRTLTEMIVQTKLFNKAKEESFKTDQEHYGRCRQLFKVVDKDCQELDRLHANVLAVEKKMGIKPGCGGVEDGTCISCTRNGEREILRAATERETKRGKKAASGRGRRGMGQVAEGKQRLDDILEEGETKEGASSVW